MMKKLAYAILFALNFAAVNGFADTPLVFSSKVTTIQGKAPADAQIEILAYFVPKFSLSTDMKDDKQTTACTFPEDQYVATGYGIPQVIKVSRAAEGSYSFAVAVGGNRGNCAYVLQSFSFTLKDKKMYVPISMRTQLYVTNFNAAMAKSRVSPGDFYNLEPSGSLSCEFSRAATDMGAWCYLGDEMIVNDILIQGTGETFTLDLVDKVQSPDDDAVSP